MENLTGYIKSIGNVVSFPTRTAKSANYTVVSADAETTFDLTGAATLTFSGSYTANMSVTAVNTGTRAWSIVGTASGTFLLYPGQMVRFRYLNATWVTDGPKRWAKATATFYVGPSGSDSNDGLTSGSPFATIDHAIAVIQSAVDTAGANPLIRLLPGTYTQNVNYAGFLTGGVDAIVVTGTSGTPGDVTVHGTWIAQDGAILILDWITAEASGGSIFKARQHAVFDVSNIVVNPSPAATVFQAVEAGNVNGGGTVTLAGDVAVLAGALHSGARVSLPTISLSANVTTTALITAQDNGQVDLGVTTFALNGHTVTGQKWVATGYGQILTGGADANTLIPGSVNGLALTGGWAGSPALASFPDVIGPTSWTPVDASGAGLSLTVNVARYYKVGKIVHFTFSITFPSTANGSIAKIGGLPVAAENLATFYTRGGTLTKNTATSPKDRVLLDVGAATGFYIADIAQVRAP